MNRGGRKGIKLSSLLPLLGLLAGSGCSINQVGLGAKVDITAPKIAFTAPSAGGQYFRGNLTVSGVASDDLTASPQITLTYTKASHIQAVMVGTASGGKWSFTVPSGTPEGIADGSSTVTAMAKDDSGKVTSVDINVIVDNLAPTILVSVPSSYGTPAPYSTSNYLEIKGEVYDPSPVAKVEVTLTDAGGAPVLKNPDGSVRWKTANGTNSWNTRIVYGTGPGADVDLSALVGTPLRYAVRATDNAKNVSARYYHVQDFGQYLTTGALFPATDAIGQFDQQGTPLVIGGTTAAVVPLDGTGARPFGDFVYDPSTRKPVIGFTNLNPDSPATGNVLGFNASIRGTISPGIALGAPALDPAKFSATVTPLGSSGPAVPLALTVQPSNGSYAFQADVKDGGVFYASGYYQAVIHAETTQGDKRDQPVVFMINTKAPWVLTDASAAASLSPPYPGPYLDRTTGWKAPITDPAGKPLPGFTLAVPVWDQNGADKVTSVTFRAYLLEGSAKTEVTQGPTAAVKPASGNVWTAAIPFPADPAKLAAVGNQIQVDLVLTNDAQLNGYLTQVYNFRNAYPSASVDDSSFYKYTDASGVLHDFVTGNMVNFTGPSTGNPYQIRAALVQAGRYADAEAAKADAETWSVANGISPWASYMDMTTRKNPDPETVDWDFWVVAKDIDGTYGTPVRVRVVYDNSPPALAETLSGTSGTGITTVKGDLVFGGTVSDPHLADQGLRVAVQKDGGTPAGSPVGLSQKPNWTWTLAADPQGHSAEGIYDLVFTASDNSGKTTSLNRRVQIDTLSPFLLISSPVASEAVESSAYTARGQVTDNGGKGVAFLDFSLDSTDGTDGTWQPINLTGLTWTQGLVFTAGQEGPKKLWVRAGDGLNLPTVQSAAFFYDQAKPVLTETGVNTSATVYRSANFSFAGTWTETNKLVSLAVSYQKDGGPGVVLQTLGPNTAGTAVPWTAAVDVDTDNTGTADTSGLQDGEYVFTLTATDVAGRTASATRTVRIDTTAPTLVPPAATAAYYDASVTLSGTAADPGSGASGVQKVQYQIGGTTEAFWLDADGTSTWSKTIGLAASPEGPLTVYFRALDNSGQASAPAAVVVNIDHTAPRATLVPAGSFTALASVDAASTSFTFSGTADDAAYTTGRPALSASLSFTKDGVAAGSVALTPSGASGWTWSSADSLGNGSLQSLTDGTRDGLYLFTLTVTDVAGKTASVQKILRVDTSAPTLSVAAPTPNDLNTTGAYTVQGSVLDLGAGLDPSAVSYVLTANGVPGAPVTASLTGSTWSKTLSLAAEGTYQLQVTAADRLGNTVTSAPVTFFYDQAKPVLTETGIGTTNTVYRSANFSLAGTWTETNRLVSIAVSYQKDGGPDIVLQTLTPNAAGSATSWSASVDVDTDNTGSADTTGLQDGEYVFAVTATDVAGRTASAARTVRIDTTPPTAPVFTSVPGPYITASHSVAGTAGDGSGSGILTMSYRLDGTAGGPATGLLTGTDDWYTTLNTLALAEGVHQVSVWATDRAGNLSPERSQSFTVDRNDPTIVSGAPLSQGTKADLVLSGTAGDTLLLGGVTASYSKDGGTAVLATPSVSGASWSVAVPVSNGPGSYEYTVTATDSVGRTKSLVRTVVIDTQAPTTAVSNIASDGSTLVSADSFTVTGSAADVGLSGLASVEYSLDSGAHWYPTTGTSSWIVPLTGLTDRLAQGFWLRAQDAAANAAPERHLTFDIDLAAPTFTETVSGIASSSVVYRNTSVSFGGTASDGIGLASLTVKYSKNGAAAVSLVSSANPANGAWSASLATALGDGAYEVTFTATDKVGKTTSFVRNVVFDTASPDLTVTGPAANELVASPAYTLRGQVTDNGGKGVAGLWYSRDGTSWTPIPLTGLNWTVANVNFSAPVGSEVVQGARTVYFKANDGIAGNADAAATVHFFYDTENPVLAETASGFGASLENKKTAVVFGGTAGDTNALTSVKVSLNGVDQGAVTDTNGDGNAATPFDTWTYTLPAANGTYALVFTATDVAGRTSTVSRNVLVDTQAPTLPVFTSTPGAYVTGTLSVAGTAGDGSGSGVQTAFYRIDGSPGDPASGTLTGTDDWFSTVNVSGLAEGTHTLAVWTADRASNRSAEASQAFTIDRSDPALGSPAASSQNTKTDLVLSGSASDANGLASVTATVRKNGGAPGAAAVTGTGAWSIGVPVSLGDGSYTFTVTAADAVGRVSTLVRTVVIDTTAPTVTVASPALLSLVSDPSLAVSGSASDNLSGIGLVEYRLNGGAWTALTGTANWNGTVALGGEGTKVLEFRSTDALLTPSAVTTVTVNLDLTPPTLTETGVGTNSPKRSADFVLSGTAGDSNGLKTWDHDANPGTAEVPYVEVSSDGGTTKTKVTVTGGNWSYNCSVPSDGTADGDKNFTVYATDSVGKVTTVSRTVTVDATPPVLAVDGVIAGLNVSANAVNGIITFRFSANDTGVGLERTGGSYQAYYTLVADGASPAASMTSWTPTASASSVFSFTVDTSAYGLSGDQNLDLWVGVRDGVTGGSNVPNSAAVKTDLKVNQDSNRPVLTTDNMNMAAAANSLNGFGQNPTILLTIEDDDAVSVSQLQYRIDANNDGDFNDVVELGTALNKWEDESVWNPVEEVPATDRSLAQAKIKLTGFPQGAFRIQIRARDNTDPAAWASVYDNAASFTWTKSPVIRFAVDYGPPTIAVTAPLAGTYNADFTLSGTAADALGVISVDYTLNGGSSYTNVFTGPGSTSAPFSVTVPAGTLPTGEYILQVEATDFGGTTATQQIPITIDRTGPTVTVLQPGLHETLNGAAVTVRGEATDNRQLGAVFLWHGKVSDPDPAVLPSRVSPGVFSSGSYTQVTGASIWSASIDTTATALTAADGYRIRMVAVDSIGNVGTPVDHLVKVDQTSDRPSIGFSNLVASGLPTPSRLALGNLSIIGTGSDDDSVKASSFQIRIDRNGDGDFNDADEGWVPISQPPASNALVVSWVHEITDLFSEGLHHVQVRVQDTNQPAGDYASGYGWNESAVVPFFIDNGPPALEVTSPTLGERFNVSGFTLTGKTQDTNGINRVVVWVDNNENTVQEPGEKTVIGWNDLNADGVVDPGEGAKLSTDNTAVNISQAIGGLTDGTKTIRVSSYDSSNALTVRELTVVIDTTVPGAIISTPGASSTVNGALAVIGTATDNYQVSKVYYSLQLTSAGTPAFPGAYTELTGQTYAWNTTINTASGAYPNGAYTLRVVVADSAGNTSAASPAAVSFTIDQTTDRPVIDVLTIDEAGTAVANLLPPSLAISGTVQDDDAVDRTKIQVRSRALPSGTFGAWTSVTGQPAANSALAIWSHTFAGFADGQYEFEVRAADINDSAYGTNSSAVTVPVQFSVDLSLPTGTITAPVQASFHKSDVTVSGTASDASGIKKVSIAFDSGSGYGAETVLYSDTNAADGYVSPYNWTTVYPVSNGDAQVFFRVTITDAFDKVRTLEQYFTVDTLAPTVSVLLPSSGSTVNGSVLARGAANDGNQVSAVYFKVNNVTGPGTWATGDPATNGWTLLAGKYNWEQRFKSTSLADGAARIYLMAVDAAGNRSDPTQAANQLDFTVAQAGNKPVVTITTPNNALLDNSGTITGTVTDDDSVDAATVQINLGSGWVTVSTVSASGPTVSFSHSLAGLTQRAAPYAVQVRASDTGEDFAGTADDIPPAASDIASVSIKKDDGAPTVGITNLNNGLLTVTTLQGVYLKDRLTLTGTAGDGVQVALVEARLPGIAGAGQFGDAAVTSTGTDYSTWTWALAGLTLPGTTVNLEVRVTDVNGRSATTAYTLLVDTAAPSAAIDTPAANPDTVSGAYNGTLVFRGSASDLVKVEGVYYRWGASAAAQPAGSYAGWTLAGSTYSWSTAPFDSAAVFSDALDHSYHLSVVSVDSAGNESPVQDRTFTINQSSDKPEITLSQPTAGQVLETNAKTTGSATDDDGLASFEYRIDRNNDGDFSDAGESYTPTASPASPGGKSQNFENSLAALADGAYRIQIRVRDSGYASAPAGLQPYHEAESPAAAFSLDTQAPALGLTQITVQNRYDAGTTVISSGFNGSYVNNDFTLRFSATDASGIASVAVSLDNSTFTPAAGAGGSLYDAALPISALADGTRSVYYKATDNNGKVTSGLLTLLVDKTVPVVSFLSPSGIYKDDAPSTANASSDAPNVNGTAVTVSGSVTDGSAIGSLTIVGGKSGNVSLTNTTGNNTSWSVTFNATLYANSTYAVETGAGTNVWRFPLQVTAYDAAGMRTISTGYVDLDPDGDKPIVIISTPMAGASVTGIITLNGTVTDDDGTSGTVDIGLDTNNDGVFTDQVFAGVPVSNGAWTQQINSSGTLTGTVSFRVTPKDVNGKVGDPQQRTIFIDSSLPTITGWNGSAETAAPTPLTGTKQKGTITVRALFKDDDTIPEGNLQVSLDGGTTYKALSTQPGYIRNLLADAGGKKRYDVRFDVNTATYFSNNSGNGTASVILQITDNTYKPAVVSLSYAVDNRPPEVAWDPLATLTAPQSGVYSFYGSGLTNLNKVIGTAVDGGSVSGISSVAVYFVKAGAFRDPKLLTGSTPQTLAGTSDGLYTLLPFTAAAVNTATDVLTLDRTAANPASLGGTVNNALPVRFVGSSLPGGLDANTLYYVRDAAGSTFQLSVSPTDATRVDLTSAGSGQMEYALSGIPYTTDAYTDASASGRYALLIDKRTELGSNDGNANGDGDGFQESLKDGGGYDDWFAYFDSTKLPDGPVDVYQVVTDNSGNKVVGKIAGQITNSPPSITGITMGGIAASGTPDLKVLGLGTSNLVLTAADINTNPNIVSSSWLVTVEKEYAVTGGLGIGAENTGFTSFYYGTNSGGNWKRDFSSRTGGGTGSASATVSVNTVSDGFTEARWYKVTAKVLDIDGNVASKSFYLLVNNVDGTAPTTTMNALTQTSIAPWVKTQGPISLSVTAANVNATTDTLTATLPAWAVNGQKVAFAGSAAPAGLVPGTIYYIANKTATTLQLAAASGGSAVDITAAGTGPYRLVSGGYVDDNSLYQGSDPDVSGAVFLTGTAFDDKSVQSVTLEISTNGGSTWSTLGTAVLGTPAGDVISGYTYGWTYLWNTAEVANVARTDVQVRAFATDPSANSTPAASRAGQTGDVAPYITEIKRTTTGLKTNRTTYGRYSVYQSEGGIQVIGFNLNPTSAGLYPSAAGTGTPDALTVSGIDAGYTSFNLATGASTRAGWLGLRVNSLDAVNNVNSPAQAYNQASGTDSAASTWSDDRYFYLWKTGEYFGTAATPATNPEHPAMTIHQGTSRLFGAWSSYATSDVFFAGTNTDASPFRSRVYHTYDTAEYLDIVMDSDTAVSGKLSLAWLANNSSSGSYADGHVSAFPYERTTGFLNGDVSATDGAANLPGNASQWTRDGFANWYYQGESLDYDKILFQFQSVRTARYGVNTHWAYYDSVSKTVKYGYVSTATNTTGELATWLNLDGTTGDTNGAENTREVSQGIARTSMAGEFLSIALDDQYFPVVVYYDDVAKSLRLARANAVAPTATTNWTRQTVFAAGDPADPANGLLASNGKHISALVDDNGFLHIAFWSDDTGYLYYIKSTNNPAGGAAYTFGTAQVVDSTGTAGVWADLTLDRSVTPNQPYITYLNSARVNTKDGLKMAFYDAVKGGWENIVVANSTTVVEKRPSIEYKRGGSPAWNAAIGYASSSRFEVTYFQPPVP